MTPFTAPLEFQRRQLEALTDAVDRTRALPDQLERMERVDVGETPHEVVYRENKLELRYYESTAPESERHDVPILLVYALINRPYILDLQPDRSVVRALLDGGFDVYMIDWGEPSLLDASLTLEDYVTRYLENCVDEVRERSGRDSVHVLGYCMGGTMSAMYAALNPAKVRTLALMAAGLYFEGTGGVLELWGDEEHFAPGDVVDACGNVPAEFLDVGFALMDPVHNYVTKYARLYDNVEDDEFVENFARMEEWLGDGIDVAGATYEQFLTDVYQGNKLARNEMELGGVRVDVEELTMPVLQIVGEYDHLIPPAASKPFNDVVGSDDVTTFEFPTGHIGLSVSGRSHAELWPDVCEWFAERSGDREAATAPAADDDATAPAADDDATAPAADDDATGAVESSDDGATALVAVKGVGPAYAERLREAGIRSLPSLARVDPDAVADAIEVPKDRVRDWVEQAREMTDSGADR